MERIFEKLEFVRALFFQAGVLSLFIIGCSSEKSEDITLSFKIHKDDTPAAKFEGLLGEIGNLSTEPTSVSQIDCIGVMVGYTDGLNNKGFCFSGTGNSIPVASYAGLLPFSSGTALSAERLPRGGNVDVTLFGFGAGAGARCVPIGPNFDPHNLDYSEDAYILGSQNIDLRPGPNEARMASFFNANETLDECDDSILNDGTINLNNNLVAFWKFDEASGATVIEDSFFTNDLSWYTGSNSASTGKFGNASKIADSANTFLSTDITNLSSDLNMGSGDKATISGWYSFQPIVSVGEDLLWSTLNGVSGIKIARYKTGGASLAYLRVEVGYGGGSSDNYDFTDCTLPSLEMGMLTITVDSSVDGRIKAYKNAALCGQESLMNSVSAPTTTPTLTLQAHSGSSFLVDALGFWSRALSPTAISRLYNSGAGKQYPF